MHTTLSSATKTVTIGPDQPFAIIGERINPTGRKVFQQQLRDGDLSRIAIDVEQQVAGGAMLLDVNMGAPLADEAALMVKAVTLIQQLTDLPLVIDSSIPEVLEAGLAHLPGQGAGQLGDRRRRAAAHDPAARQASTARPLSGCRTTRSRSQTNPKRRLELARKLIAVATDTYKIPLEDIVIDPLAMPVGADTGHTGRTLETLALLRQEFGVNTTLGASNLSFGMPRPAGDHRRVPAARRRERADQRDHGRPLAAGRPRRQGS